VIQEKQKTQLVFDMESLGTEDRSVILSFAAIPYHLEADAERPLADFVDRAFYCKFDVTEQVNKYKRLIDPSTVEWWAQQSLEAQKVLRPSEQDVSVEWFYDNLKTWTKTVGYDPRKGLAWQRGTIDIAWHDSLMRDLGVQLPDRSLIWYMIRDIRTAVDCMAPTQKLNGMPDGFDESLAKAFPNVIDHDPVHDCIKQLHQLRMIGVW
jgi:hypothetical protein